MAQELEDYPAQVVSTRANRISYEEFLARYDEFAATDAGGAEWVDGEVIKMSPASDKHQDLVDFLTALLRILAETKDSGAVRSSPFQMKTAFKPSGREPDIVFVAKENLHRLKPTYLDGAADVAIEIISPESQARDRGDKFYEYEKGGVREYWLVDSARKQVEFYLLNENGIYQTATLENGVFRSTVIEGFYLRVEWLWREPLPQIISILREWKLI